MEAKETGRRQWGVVERANMERRRRGDGRRRWESVPWACAAHSRHLVGSTMGGVGWGGSQFKRRGHRLVFFVVILSREVLC